MGKLSKIGAVSESRLTEILKEAVERDKGFYFKIHGHAMQKAGVPDIYVAWPGVYTGWIELKVGSNKVSAIQKYQICELQRCGALACVLRLQEDTVSVEQIPWCSESGTDVKEITTQVERSCDGVRDAIVTVLREYYDGA